MKIEDYRLQDEKNVISPALIYYKDAIENNIESAIKIAGNAEQLWPHIKTHKCDEMIKLLISYGINKFKTATIAEAEVAAKSGASQIILAYPLIGPNVARFIKLQQTFPNIVFWAIGDDFDSVEILSKQSIEASIKTNFLIDVDMGMGRTGIPARDCLAFYHKCQSLEGLRVGGFHCYDGHRTENDFVLRRKAATDSMVPVLAARDELRKMGQEPVLVMGGTPSFPCYSDYDQAFLSPGTCFINDAGYNGKFPDMSYFKMGAAVMCRVISHPTGRRFTLDLGYKAIGADPGIPRGVIVGHEDEYRTVIQSEEHWTLEPVDIEASLPPIGSVFYVIP